MRETYSEMANTEGGEIILGENEVDDGECEIQGLDDIKKIEKDFWSTINNRGKINLNLLTNEAIHFEEIDGKTVLVIEVPRATRRERPIFVGTNPLDGTYRRFNDGDFLCTPEEVGRMLADQQEDALDGQVAVHFGLEDLDTASLRQYRQIFATRTPAHPWNGLSDPEFLEQIGGWRKDRATGQEGLAIAG